VLSLRGLVLAKAEYLLACLAHNFGKLRRVCALPASHSVTADRLDSAFWLTPEHPSTRYPRSLPFIAIMLRRTRDPASWERGRKGERCLESRWPRSQASLSQKFGRLRHVPKSGLSAELLAGPVRQVAGLDWSVSQTPLPPSATDSSTSSSTRHTARRATH
jgi:hypothetical protein